MKKEMCRECLLKDSKEIPFRSYNNDKDFNNKEIVIVLESPGSQELKQGQMLIGPSLKVVDKEIKRVGLDTNKIFLANATRCQILKDEYSDGQISTILACCRPNLEKAIHTIKPKLIICTGAIALKQIYGKMSLKQAREQFLWSEEFGCHVFCSYHPAYCLRNPNSKPAFSSDFDKIARFVANNYQTEQTVTYYEVDSIRPILDGDCYTEGNYYCVGIDTETQGVDWEDPNSITISYQVSKNMYEGWTIILHSECTLEEADFTIQVQRGGTKKKPKYETIGIKRAPNYEQKIEELTELLGREDIKKYYMNQKYEMHRFINLGISEFKNNCVDVKLMSHCLDSERFRDVTLETLISQFTATNENPKGLVSEAEKSDMLGLLAKDRDRFIKYASLDPTFTLQVTLALKKEILKDKQSLNYYVNFAHPIENEFLFELERNGVKVDTEQLPKVKEKIVQEMTDITENFRNKCPKKVAERHSHKFRLSRDIIIKEALFEWTDGKLNKNQREPEHHNHGFNLEPIVWNKKSGAPGTDKKQVMRVILEGKYPKKVKDLVETYQRWSELNKLLTNYISNIERKLTKDGRLHPSLSVTFTSSGRTGARNPALQTIPKRSKSAEYIRKLFVAPEGYKLVEADYHVSELRWVAHIANDKKLQEIFKEGKDPHSITGIKMKGLHEDYQFKDEKEKKETRQSSKPVNFGLIYLLTSKGLQKYAEQEFGQKFSLKQTEQFRNTFMFSLYKQIPIWHRKDETFLREKGYLRSVFGRKRILPNIWSDEESLQQQALRTGVNFRVQSPSSDATLLGGYNFIKDKDFARPKCRPVLSIHDALIFEVDTEFLNFYVNKVKHYMENIPTETFGFTLKIPLKTEVEAGDDLNNTEEA